MPGSPSLGEAQRTPVFVEEVLLLQADPQVRIIFDGRAHVAGMRGAVRMHHLAQHDESVLAAGVRIERHRVQDAVRALAFGLQGGAAIKSPERHVCKGRGLLERLQCGLAAQTGNGRFAIEPDVFKFVFRHRDNDLLPCWGLLQFSGYNIQPSGGGHKESIKIRRRGEPAGQGFRSTMPRQQPHHQQDKSKRNQGQTCVIEELSRVP